MAEQKRPPSVHPGCSSGPNSEAPSYLVAVQSASEIEARQRRGRPLACWIASIYETKLRPPQICLPEFWTYLDFAPNVGFRSLQGSRERKAFSDCTAGLRWFEAHCSSMISGVNTWIVVSQGVLGKLSLLVAEHWLVEAQWNFPFLCTRSPNKWLLKGTMAENGESIHRKGYSKEA